MSEELIKSIANLEGKETLRTTKEKIVSRFLRPAFDSMAVSLAKEWLEVK